jgi:hypothetical protein
MTDHQLSTRDLAARTDSDDSDSSLEREQPTERTSGPNVHGDQDSFQSSQADAAPIPDPRADQPQMDSRASDGGVPPGATSGEVETQTSSAGTDHEPLFPSDQSDRFTARWQEIQTSFVDHPREAVAEADTLVADLMQRLAASFSQERERLETQWDRGDDVSTEELRVALTRYRSFFDRLLHA